MNRSKKIILAVVIALVIVIAGGVGGWLYYDYSSRVYTACVAEAGTEIVAADFLKNTDKEAAFTEDSEAVDIHVPGTYTVSVKSGMFTYHCEVTIEDTVAPTATGVDVYIQYNESVTPEQFVCDVVDETATTVSFEKEPDVKQYGKQYVTVLIEDLGGNTYSCQSLLVVRPTVEELTVEAGSEVPALEEFLLTENTTAQFVTDMEEISTSSVQDYEIEIREEQETYTSILHVVDTVAPVLEAKNVAAYTTSQLEAKDFVKKAQDVTSLTYSFKNKPDYSMTEAQDITICVVDEGGNQAEATVSLTLQEDTQAPVITASDMLVNLGDSISYRNNAKVTDNCDKDIALDVDASQVNVNAEGVYSVTFSATDRAGNSTSKTITVTVRKKGYTEADVYALCDQVLGRIITDGMSEYDKLSAIYYWIRGNVAYTNHSDKINWVQGAYEGLALHKGDCYVFACTAKALLTRAGIQNADIAKIPSKTQHFWNVVNIGEGWRHFDTCPRKDKSVFLYMTDEDLLNYSNSHNLTHNYDKSIYTFFEE